MTPNLLNLVAIKDDEKGSMYLGRLCWYTIPDNVAPSRAEVEDAFDELGLPKEWLPLPIKGPDAFRRASAQLERKNIELDENTHANLLVREVVCDKRGIERHLIWEVRDAQERRLSYQKVAAVRYDRDYESATAEAEIWAPAVAQEACDAFGGLYSFCQEHYDGGAVRKTVARMVYNLMAVAVRPSGAVYFVPEKRASELAKVGGFVKALGAEYFEVPVMDAADTKDMVLRNLKESVGQAISSLADTLKDPKVSKGAISVCLSETKHLIEQVNEYKSLLQMNLADLSSKLELLKLQALSLVDKAGAVGSEAAE